MARPATPPVLGYLISEDHHLQLQRATFALAFLANLLEESAPPEGDPVLVNIDHLLAAASYVRSDLQSVLAACQWQRWQPVA